MTSLQDFENLIRLAKYIGILSTTFNRRTSQLSVTKFDRLFELLMNIILCFAILCTSVVYFYFISWEFYGSNTTGRNTFGVQLFAVPVVRILEVLWIFLHRKRNLKILRLILSFLNEQPRLRNKLTRMRCCFPITISLIVTVNIWLLLLDRLVRPVSWFLFIIFLVSEISSSVQSIHVCLLLWFYSYLVIWTGCLLEVSNTELCLKTQFDRKQLQECLQKRSRLIDLCSNEINRIYGIIFLIITVQLFLMMPTVPFLILEYVFESEMMDLVSIVRILYSFLVPIVAVCMGYCFALMANELDSKANKTARILSRISRRGTDIEKMVDKFLMKNMQQKPILTAYGFFPLNKRTLFKIFAAIFTYMVILIQFKNMENTNKSLAETRTTTETY